VVDDDVKIAELRAIVESIRDRVRARHPDTSVVVDSGDPEPIRVPVSDLMPIVHARDAAQAKMASIGSVNPRAGGPLNNTIQSVKRLIARGLNWMVRDQIIFNRGALACVEATVDSLNDLNRALQSLGGQIDARLRQDRQAAEARLLALEARNQELSAALGQFAAQWNRSQSDLARREMERDQRENEWRQQLAARDRERDTALSRIAEDFRRTVDQYEARALAQDKNYSDLAKAQHGEFSQLVRAQHAEFAASRDHAANAIQHKLEQDLLTIKMEFERLIHNELRVVRQRGIGATPLPASSAAPMDYQAFSDRFRGSERHVRENQRFYAGRFQGEVLDLGCGHGEFLEVMRDAGVHAKGVDQSAESIAYCRSKGLNVEQADLFAYLDAQSDRSLDGIFTSQVVEHLPANSIPKMIELCAAKLRAGGLIAIETPNPACLAIFATHFYLDPTHVRPVPSQLLAFYLEEQGFGGIEVVDRFPAADTFPELNELAAPLRNKFFGGQDYVIFARKL
jgi:2-polyprenyl-3-methyl-5-hydroxy-6-metoxy-1,4-benzoquinol methylase